VTKFSFLDRELPPEAQRIFEQGKTVRTLVRGHILYRAGDDPVGLHFIRNGLMGLIASGSRGNEYLIRLSKAGHCIGHPSLFSREPHHATSVALEHTEVVSVAKDIVFHVLEKYPAVALLIMESLSKSLKLAELARVSIADKDAVSRVAETVLYLKERFPEHKWTRKEIAEFCGSTTATVIRILARFEDEGIIHQAGRNIEIKNRPKLLALATVE
jgi:CRP-like cAMP-binding protein